MSDSKRSQKAGSTRVYESAVDWWIWIVLLAPPLACLGTGIGLIWLGQNVDATWFFLGAIGTLIVTAAFTVPCRYTILPDTLTVRCGIIFYRIPLEKIQAVEKSGSWLSGPALSLKRVKVSTPSKFHLLSPQDREQFIEDLNQAIDNLS